MESLHAARQDLAAHCEDVVQSLVGTNHTAADNEALNRRTDSNGNAKGEYI